jgi:hypothetical protein
MAIFQSNVLSRSYHSLVCLALVGFCEMHSERFKGHQCRKQMEEQLKGIDNRQSPNEQCCRIRKLSSSRIIYPSSGKLSMQRCKEVNIESFQELVGSSKKHETKQFALSLE